MQSSHTCVSRYFETVQTWAKIAIVAALACPLVGGMRGRHEQRHRACVGIADHF